MHLKMSSGKRPPFYLGLNVLNMASLVPDDVLAFNGARLSAGMALTENKAVFLKFFLVTEHIKYVFDDEMTFCQNDQ